MSSQHQFHPDGERRGAPVVTLTSPANGASYSAPATINLAASVTANGHTITKVQFYEGTSLLGEDTTTPYAFTYSNVSARTCALKATAVYDSGSTVSSAPVSVTVKAASPPPFRANNPGGGDHAGPLADEL